MSMAVKYVCVQVCAFAIATVLASLLLGFGMASLLAGLILSVLVVAGFAWYDSATGRYTLHGENLFSTMSDTQLRECYEAYMALASGKTSKSMLFYQIVTRYEDAGDNGYEQAVDDLTSEIAARWTHYGNNSPRRVG